MDTWQRYAGGVPYALWVVELLMLALTYDRVWALARAAGPLKSLTEALRPALRAGDLETALGIAARTPGAGARVAMSTLRHALSSPGLQSAVADARVAAELAPVRRRLPWAKHLAGIATLVGLLGHMHALLPRSFGPMSPSARTKWLARLIVEGLVSIDAALVLTALCLVLAAGLTGVVNHFESSLRRETLALLGLLREHRAQLRLQVGVDTLRAHMDAPATYR